MYGEDKNESCIDRVQAFKEEQALLREQARQNKEAEAERVRLEAEAEVAQRLADAELNQQEIEESYKEEKEDLSTAIETRDGLLKRLAEIKQRRGEIISMGHTARGKERNEKGEIIKQDEEIENILHTKEGFNNIFEAEDKEWQMLRGEVEIINLELSDLEESISKKQEITAELFNQTNEGRAAKAEKERLAQEQKKETISGKFLNFRNIKLSELKGGRWDYNILNSNQLTKISEAERVEIIQIVKDKFKEVVEQNFKNENQENGLEVAENDINRVKGYEKERESVLAEIRDFRKEAFSKTEELENLFKENKKASDITAHYYGGNRDLRNRMLVYLNTFTADNFLLEVANSVGADLNNNPKMPNLEVIKDYIGKAREFSDKIISLIKNNDLEKLEEVFGFSYRAHTDYFGFNPNQVGDSLQKIHYSEESLIKNKVFPTKNIFSLEQQLAEKLKEQDIQKSNILAFSDANLDRSFLMEEARSINIYDIRSIRDKIKKNESDKLEAQAEIYNLEDLKVKYTDRMDEEVSFDLKSLGTTLGVPKFASDIKKIDDNEALIKLKQAKVRETEQAISVLVNKKLGLFDSKRKHEEEVAEKKIELDKFQEELKGLNREEGRLLNDDPKVFCNLFDTRGAKRFKYKNEADLAMTSTLGEMIVKIEKYLNTVINSEVPAKEMELLNKYEAATEEINNKQKVLSFQKR